jgi:hypothetical protein
MKNKFRLCITASGKVVILPEVSDTPTKIVVMEDSLSNIIGYLRNFGFNSTKGAVKRSLYTGSPFEVTVDKKFFT